MHICRSHEDMRTLACRKLLHCLQFGNCHLTNLKLYLRKITEFGIVCPPIEQLTTTAKCSMSTISHKRNTFTWNGRWHCLCPRIQFPYIMCHINAPKSWARALWIVYATISQAKHRLLKNIISKACAQDTGLQIDMCVHKEWKSY